MGKSLMVAVAALLVTGCVSSESLRLAPVALSDGQMAAIRARVAASIPDSASAEFLPRMLAGRHASGETLACGGVKFRNRLGGMEDYTPFIVGWPSSAGPEAARSTVGQVHQSTSVVMKTCDDFGLLGPR